MAQTRDRRCGSTEPHDHHHWTDGISDLWCCDGSAKDYPTVACQFGSHAGCPDPDDCTCTCHLPSDGDTDD